MEKAFKLGVVALLLAVVLDVLLYKQMLGLNVPLASLAFLGATTLAMYVGGHTLPMRARVAGVFAFLFALPFALGTSDQMMLLATFGFLSAHLLFAAFAVGHEAKFTHPVEILWSGTGALSAKLLGRLDFLTKLKPPAMSQKSWAVGKGIIVLIPLLAIFIALFASADPVFNSYFEHLGDWLNNWSSPQDIFVQVFLITCFFLGAALFFGASAFERYAHEAKIERTPSWSLESKVILIGLIVLFAAFLILQGSTMFGGAAAFAKIDMTYAEYAHQGFNQLIVVGVLVALIVLTMREFHGVKVDHVLTTLHATFIVETLLVMVSAAMRLNLYIDTYGFTAQRLLAYWGILTIGILLVMLLANVLQRESQVILMNRALVVLGICALVFCYSMPDAMSTRLNFRRADAGKEIDYRDFHLVSEEATPAIIQGLQTPRTFKDPDHLDEARRFLEHDKSTTNPIANDWRGWNLARMRANDLLPAPVPVWLYEATEHDNKARPVHPRP